MEKHAAYKLTSYNNLENYIFRLSGDVTDMAEDKNVEKVLQNILDYAIHRATSYNNVVKELFLWIDNVGMICSWHKSSKNRTVKL